MVRVNLQFPTGAVKHYERWIGDGDLADFGRAVEQAGFDATSMTDHPFPPDDWLGTGGHHAFDPFVALTFVAAATTSLKLMTYLLVASYRNPYTTAKAIASLDLLSGGRTVVGMGTGYLEAEFGVLGADFAGRGRTFDEAVGAMRAVWPGESVEHHSDLFAAHGHTMLPRPAQRPGPPIWIGGNSHRAMRRAAELGNGWMPFFQPAAMSQITGTAALETPEQLGARVRTLHAMRAECGTAGDFDVCIGFSAHGGDPAARAPDLARQLPALADAGATWVSIELASRSLVECFAEIETLAEHLLRVDH